MARGTQRDAAKRLPRILRIPVLLWTLALGALAVGAVVAAVEIGAVWAAPVAFLVLVGATAEMTFVLGRFLRDDTGAVAWPARASGRWPALTIVALAAAAVVVAVLVPRHDDVTAATSAATPAGATQTVREFLVSAYVDGNGDAACLYLSVAEQNELAAAEPSGACSDALDDPADPSPFATLTSSGEVQALSAGVRLSNGTATVRLDGVAFVLRPASGAEQSQFAAPPSYWRIASGVPAPSPASSSSLR